MTGTPGHILLSIGGGDVVVRPLLSRGFRERGGGLAVQQVGNAASKLINVRIANNTITGAVGTAYGPGVSHRRRDGDNFGLRSPGTRRRRLVRPMAVASMSLARRLGCWWRTPPFTRTRWSRPLRRHSVAGSLTIANSVTTVRSSTITNNIAGNTVSLAGYGGNIHRQAPISVENSIVADGAAALGITANCNESVDFSGRNIVSDTTCGAANASRSISDPLLGPLVTTTSGTDFRMPALTSPALDAAVGCARG